VCPEYRTGIPVPLSDHIYSQQIYLLNFLRHAAQSPSFSPQNALYFIMLSFLVHKIFTFYIKGVQKFKCRGLGPVQTFYIHPVLAQKHCNLMFASAVVSVLLTEHTLQCGIGNEMPNEGSCHFVTSL
jgi:hypothetical protein